LALYNPVWTSSVRTPGDFGIALVGFVFSTVWRATADRRHHRRARRYHSCRSDVIPRQLVPLLKSGATPVVLGSFRPYLLEVRDHRESRGVVAFDRAKRNAILGFVICIKAARTARIRIVDQRVDGVETHPAPDAIRAADGYEVAGGPPPSSSSHVWPTRSRLNE
jgi:hypothetical protein